MKHSLSISKNTIMFCAIYTVFFLLRIPSFLNLRQGQSFLLISVVYTALLTLGVWTFRDFFKSNLRWIKANKLKSIGWVILIYLTILVVSIVLSIVYDFLLSFFHLTDIALQNDNNIQNVTKIFNPIIGIFILAFAGPIVEEIFFRLILISELSKKIPSYMSILISSIIFASMHIHNLELSEFISIIPHFGFGLVVGSYYYKTNNIIFTIIVHVFINFSGVLPLYMN